MPIGHRLIGLPALFLLLFLPACDKPTTPTRTEADPGQATTEAELDAAGASDAAATVDAIPFSDAEIFFELNSTANDLGLQIALDTDDGWRRVRVLDPSSNDILLFQTAGRLNQLGITELRFETAEPTPEEVLALFPPGQYRFRGGTVEGQHLASVATLSHDFPPPPTFHPSGGEVVDVGNTVVEWNAPDAEKVEVIIEQDELEHLLDITLSGDATRLRVPRQFLTPGTEYKIEILSIGENGNRIITESTFRTAP
jgi:hypothetical protein